MRHLAGRVFESGRMIRRTVSKSYSECDMISVVCNTKRDLPLLQGKYGAI